MRAGSSLTLVLAFAPLLVSHTALAATQPVVGIYQTYQYVTASSSSPSGLTSCNPVGAELGGYFSYPGPSKTGAQSYGPAEVSSTLRMLVCTYPVTPAAGATSWSGTEQCTSTYLSGSPTRYTLTFNATIVYDTKNTWLEQRTITYPVTGGTCTETRNVGLSRTGK